MTRPLPGALALLPLLAFLLSSGACKRPGSEEAPPRPPASATASSKPVDHLAQGELLESDQKVFGLALPRVLRVTQRNMGRVVGSSDSSPEHLANFFRARVGGGKILVGSTSTQFLHVRPRADPSRELDIRVEQEKNGTHVNILDVTTPPFPTPTSAAEARKQAGLTPDGKLLDPKRIE